MSTHKLKSIWEIISLISKES